MRHNILRERLNAGQATLGTHVDVPWPGIVELCGHSGQFDYIEFVAEYAPYDLFLLENIGRAIDLFPHMSGMIKVEQDPRMYVTIRALGSGIQNLLFADVRTPDDVRACVRAVRAESPRSGGLHGVGMRRDVGYVLEGGTEAFEQALNDAVICLMIEKHEAVEALEEILAVPGVDMVQFGPADYAMSIGQTGNRQHPDVKKAERKTIEMALERGIAPRVELGDPKAADPYLEMGVQHYCIGWDVRILHQWYEQQGKAMLELLERAGAQVPARPAKPGISRGGYGT